MKRARRIVYRLLSGVSLLLLVATAGVWVRSYWVSDLLNWYDWPPDRSFFDNQTIWCSRGGVGLLAQHYLAGSIHSVGDVHFQHDRFPGTLYPDFARDLDGDFSLKPRRYAALGFQWVSRFTAKWNVGDGIDGIFKSLTVPLYFPCLLFTILPAHYVLRVRRRRRIAKRIAQGCCIACGYDLRASSGRCPECGRER